MAGQLSKFKPEEPFAGIDRAKFLEFLDRYNDADNEVSGAVAARKDLRAAIKAAGIPLKAFDRARHDADVSGEVREKEELWYRRMMLWQSKPVGFQPSFDLETSDTGEAAVNVAEMKKVDNEGTEAAKTGRRRDSNPWTPGTELHQRWDTAYLRGQGERRSDPPKRRGRPRKDGSPAQSSGPDLTVHDGGAAAAVAESDTRH